MMSDEKKAVTDDSDCDDCVGDEDEEDDTQLMHKQKTAGKLTLYLLTSESIVINDIGRSFFSL